MSILIACGGYKSPTLEERKHMTNVTIWYCIDRLEIELWWESRYAREEELDCCGYPSRHLLLSLSPEQLAYMDVFDPEKLAERMGESHCYHYHSEPGQEFLVSGSIPVLDEDDFRKLEQDLSRGDEKRRGIPLEENE